MILDDAPAGAARHEVREKIMEALYKPVDPEELLEYERDQWAKKNQEANAAGRFSGHEAVPRGQQTYARPAPESPRALPPAGIPTSADEDRQAELFRQAAALQSMGRVRR